MSAISSSVEATGQDPAGDKPSLTFTRGEDGYYWPRLKEVFAAARAMLAASRQT